MKRDSRAEITLQEWTPMPLLYNLHCLSSWGPTNSHLDYLKEICPLPTKKIHMY